MKKIIAIVLAALMVCCLFAACSGNDAETTAPAGDDTTAPVQEKAAVKVIDIALTDEDYAFGVSKDDAELLKASNELIAELKANGKLDEIVNKYYSGSVTDGTFKGIGDVAEDASKDQLVVSTNAAFPPFEFKEGETYYGIDIELAQLLAEKLNKELVIKNVEFNAVCTSVDKGYADVAMAGLTINETRKESVTFSDSYYKSNQCVIAAADDTAFDNCKTAADVEAVLKTFDATTTIGVQNGTTGQYYVKGDVDWGFDGFAVTSKGYSSGALAVQDLINGNLKYVVIDKDPATYIANSVNAVS